MRFFVSAFDDISENEHYLLHDNVLPFFQPMESKHDF